MSKTIWFELPEWQETPREVKEIPGLGMPARSNDEFPDWLRHVAQHIQTINQEIRSKWSGREKARAREIQRIKADGRYWCNVHAGIYESRVDEEEPTALLAPFILYPFQDWTWQWMDEVAKKRGRLGDGVIVKSRDMGITNLMCARFTHKWLTKTPYQCRLLSRKEDLVDDKFSPDSMMWKIEYFIKSLYPPLFDQMVPNFNWRSHRNDGKIANPNNSNLISGESTNATAGRGGRCTEMGMDEMNFMRNGKGIWTATRPATYHRFGASSAGVNNEGGLFFHDLVEPSQDFPPERKPSILRVYNSLHPYHDAQWLAQERERDSEAGIRQEIFMEWFSDDSDFVWPDMSKKELGDFPYVPGAGPIFVGFDDGMDNDWATLWLQLIKETGRLRVVEAHKRRGQIADFYGTIYTGLAKSRYTYTPEDIRVMQWVRSLDVTPIYFGDTHGEEVQITSGLSAHGILASDWGITVNIDYQKRTPRQKIDAVGDLIDRLDFHTTPGVAVALSDIQRWKWKKIREGAELTSEYRQPAHSRDSHSAHALGHFAVQWWEYQDILTSGGSFVYYADEYEDETSEQSPHLAYADIR